MTYSGEPRDPAHGNNEFVSDDAIDLRDLFARLWRGMPQILGLALLGLAFAGFGYMIFSPFQSVSTSTRVVFAFAGFEKNQYPDGSKFQADDIRAPDVVLEALKRRNLDTSSNFQSQIRAALSIEGIIPPYIIKDRDRLRAAGQTPAVYVPDEYTVKLTLPRKFPLDKVQRQQLLNEIVSVYRENFRRTYADTPLSLGNALTVLKNADYPDYEAVFDREMRSIMSYLTEKSDTAKLFRSPTTNLTFSDLLKQAQLFSQIYLYEVLGLIRENGLAHNRKIALVKMYDALRQLNDEERRALNAESVVTGLLKQAGEREQNYVLGIKGQATQPRTSTPVVDQSVIDSLLANDSYSFLVKQALQAGLKVKQVQDEKAWQLDQIENMKAVEKAAASDQAAVIAQVAKSMSRLEIAYNDLIDSIRKTHNDYSRQTFGDAVRLSDQINNESTIRPIVMPAAVGGFLGFALGAGLSLLGIYIGRKVQPVATAA
ncbi:MAG: hypothetical protein QM715_03720 [Nibricoccus sp.]